MKKEAYYFSHDANAKDDPKILQLRMEMGWEGYGLFWALIEMLRNESDHKMRTHYKSIAFALHTQEDSIKKLINDFDLFAIEGEYFWSESLLKRMEMKESKSEKARQSAKKRWNQDNDANAMRTHSDSNANAMQLKESKVKESKGKEISKDTFISLDEVEVEMSKEKPMQRSFFIRMQYIYNLDENKVKEAFKNWKILKEGEAMTISKAQNSFNLYLKNNASTGYSESKEVHKPKYAKSTIEDNWW
jgi:hypothetical protein